MLYLQQVALGRQENFDHLLYAMKINALCYTILLVILENNHKNVSFVRFARLAQLYFPISTDKLSVLVA